MKEETDDYTIGDYVSQHLGMLIEETMTCLTCHEKKRLMYLKMTRLFFHWKKLHTQKGGDTLFMRKGLIYPRLVLP